MAGTPSYIQMPVDGAGKQVQAWSNSISGNTVYAEAVVIVDSTGTEKATAGNPLRIDPTGTTVQPVLDGASSATASAVPADASYVGFNSSGNLVGVSSVNPLPVTGGGGGTQYTDETAESAGAFTITVAGMYNGTQVVGLRSDASDNLFVNLKTALPAGSNLIGSVTALGAAASGSAVTGNPILVGGSDGTDARTLKTGSDGTLIVEFSGAGVNTDLVQIGSTNVFSVTNSGDALMPSALFDGNGNVLTSNSSNPTGKHALDVNIMTVLGTAPTTAGFINVIGAAASGSAVAGNPVLIGGSDGTDARTLSTNSSGQLVVVGAGTAGSGSGGVLSIQGVASGVTVPITGTVTAVTSITNPVTVVGDAASGSAVAGNPVLIGGSDGTDARTFLTDTSGQLKVLLENTPAVTGSGIFEVSPTTAANTKTNAFFTEISDGTNTVTTNSTTYTSKYGLDVNLLGTLGTAFTTAGVVNIQGVASGTVVPAVISVATSGGATPKGYHISSNAVQAIKSSAGQLYGYFLDNTANSATTYFQFFNIASGSVSLGSSASLFVIPVPGGSAANLSMTEGWAFGTAMSFAATTTYNGSTFAANAVDCTIAYD